MYFSGNLEVDPSKLTKIEVVKPDKFFKKILHTLTGGATSEKQERETFSALAVMNQIYSSLKDRKINNIIRLSVNEHDFYLDTKGEKDDLDKAVFEAEAKIDPLEAKVFNNMLIILEHEATRIKYLIEVDVERVHEPGHYPIKVTINGLMEDFKAKPGETREQLEQRMKSIFKDQQTYDTYVATQKSMFDSFMNDLGMSVKKFMQVDDVKVESKTKIVRPKEKVKDPSAIKYDREKEPVYHGYYGFESFFFYSMLWSGALYGNNLFVHDAVIVDDAGNDVMSVGEEGFMAGESNALNEEASFEPPAEGDTEVFGGNEFEGDLSEAGALGDAGGGMEDAFGDAGGDIGGESDWLSGGGIDFGDFGDFDI